MAKDKKETLYSLRQHRLVVQNERFNVFLDDVEDAAGGITSNYLVVAPKIKTGDLITGVAVLPVVDGKLGLLRLYRHALGRYLWEIPRGFIDAGETDRNSALRELEEETGLSCADSDLEYLGAIAPEPGILAARVHLFVALRCHVTRPFHGDEFGHVDFRLFDQARVLSLHKDDEIQDATSITAYLLYRNRQT